MRLRSFLAAAAVLALLVGACSDADSGDDLGAGGASGSQPAPQTSPPTTEEEAPDPGIVFIQHALEGSAVDEDGAISVTLRGVERKTAWFTVETAGVTTTRQFVDDDLAELLDSDVAPQAAFVPADLDQAPMLLELTEATWNEELRSVVYTGVPPEGLNPRMDALVPDADLLLGGTFQSAAVYITHTDSGRIPTPATTTTTAPPPPPTTTTEPPTTPASPATVLPPSSPDPTLPPTQPPSPPPTSPPSTGPPGQPNIVVSPLSVVLPLDGGSAPITIQNIGGGVGSWSTGTASQEGITASPTSGFLFPGSKTTVTVAYDGSRFPQDFAADLLVYTVSGIQPVKVIVR